MAEGTNNHTVTASGSSSPPSHFRKTLIGHATFEFDVALEGQNAPALLNEAYIEGLCKEQKEITKSLHILFWASLVLAWALITKSINWSTLSINVLGVSMPTGLVSKQVLYFALAVLFAQGIMKMISLLIVTQLAQKAANVHFGTGWKIYLAKYEADSLWSSLLIPRTAGYVSPVTHYIFSITMVVVIFLISFTQLVFVNIVSLQVFGEIWESAKTPIESCVALLSFLLITSASLAILISTVVPFKFRLKERR